MPGDALHFEVEGNRDSLDETPFGTFLFSRTRKLDFNVRLCYLYYRYTWWALMFEVEEAKWLRFLSKTFFLKLDAVYGILQN